MDPQHAQACAAVRLPDAASHTGPAVQVGLDSAKITSLHVLDTLAYSLDNDAKFMPQNSGIREEWLASSERV
tara:strand:- start:148 stop:363 length:216 start_codon:yes stop_codon:yes gene_type:complete